LSSTISNDPSKLVSIYLSMAALAFRRPRAIPAILGASWAFRSRTWYRSFPFLPIPPRSYLRWRMETAFGDPEAVPSLDDLERYLNWTARMRSRMTGRAPAGEALHD
jgi:hypothetical protein